MLTKQQIITEITWLQNFQTVIGVFEEVAASKMRQLRNRVLVNRVFFDEVNQIFQHVKTSYKNEVKQLSQKNQQKVSTIIRPNNGKTALVLISANTGLYGDIIQSSFKLFLKDTLAQVGDPVIIGQIGKILFTSESKLSFSFFEFPDSGIDSQNLKSIIETLVNFEKVYVYHGIFKNIVYQEPIVVNITADSPPSVYPYKQPDLKKNTRWLFEPTLGNVLAFFEEELFASMFSHAINEGQLAKFASRMNTLDKAKDKVKDSIDKSLRISNQLKHQEENKKRLQALSGMSLWGS